MEASALRAPAGLSRIALPTALLRLRTDDQLVALFRSGHDDAFGVLHDRYQARLLAYARQMLGGSRSDAEDTLQDVFLRAYHALRADDRPIAVKAWLYRVAHNRCIDHLRRPVPEPAALLEVSRSPSPDPSAETEQREDLRRLVADVQRLPDQQRSALLMRELEGLSYADLAAALDVTVPAVKSLLVRARIGLVEAAEARDTACCEIRDDLAASVGKGVRSSAKARRHMRECSACRDYRTEVRAIRSHVRSFLPPGSGPLGLAAKLLGIGGGGAAAGSGAVGGGAALAGGGAAAATGAKVAAIVCCAAITAGGAAELRHHTLAPSGGEPHASPAPERGLPASSAPATLHDDVPGMGAAAAAAAQHRRERAAAALLRREEPISPHGVETPLATGGAIAPEETTEAVAPEVPAATAEDDIVVAPVAEETVPAETGTAGTAQPAGEEQEADEPADPSATGSSGGLAAGS